MLITSEKLRAIYKECPKERIELFLPFLNDTMEKFEINTPARMRMFLAQIGHESGQLRYTEEIASGEAYEGRRDLGNTSTGDGIKFKGRGLIQITGKNNYILCGLDLDLPLLEHPEMLCDPELATRSGGWFWNEHNLNALADLGQFRVISYRINGGHEPKDPNGWAGRVMLLNRASSVI